MPHEQIFQLLYSTQFSNMYLKMQIQGKIIMILMNQDPVICLHLYPDCMKMNIDESTALII